MDIYLTHKPYNMVDNKRNHPLYLFVVFTLHSTARVILQRVVLQVEETSAYCTVNHQASESKRNHPSLDICRKNISL